MNTLNKAQATALFEEKAILIGERDAVPEETAIELFGASAVDHARKLGTKGELCNAYGAGEYTARYLTLNGFMRAVTYHNISQLRKQSEERSEGFNKEDYNALVYTLYNEFSALMDDPSGEDAKEEKRVREHFAEITQVAPRSPLAIAYGFFWGGVGKGIELALKIEETGGQLESQS